MEGLRSGSCMDGWRFGVPAGGCCWRGAGIEGDETGDRVVGLVAGGLPGRGFETAYCHGGPARNAG